MTTQERIANLKRIKDMAWGLKESVRITKDGMDFPPHEISEAIGSLAKAERALEKAICKLTQI